jgi:nucleoside-diphosphate-sugar epimerase
LTLKALFIGGTGVISTACAELAVERGFDLYLLNRGRRGRIRDAGQVTADISDPRAARRALGSADWDVVVDFISFRPADLVTRLELLRGRVGQFIFISSASAYRKPDVDYPVTEATPLDNPFWDYARDKIACEELLWTEHHDHGFPVTIVRPSYTYNESVIPLSFNSPERPWTVVDRMRRGLPVIIPGDGTSLWQLTHDADFAPGLLGLCGQEQAIGEAFHITTDEVLDWNRIFEATAAAAGVDRLDPVHVTSDFIAACMPERRGGLHGDKAASVVLDNSKVKRFVPGFAATRRFRDGIRRSIAWYDARPQRRQVDDRFNARCDRLIAAYRKGLEDVRQAFRD